MSERLYDIPLQKIDGSDSNLGEHQGDVMLVVNVASKCGLTPQYEGLEKIFEKYRDQGFSVIGFPANDFAGQEPGSNDEIQTFCSTSYGVEFPLYAKIKVTGDDKHPVYQHLISAQPHAAGRERMETSLRGYKMDPNPEPEVLWNFEKFLVDRQGQVVGRFAPDTPPESDELVAAIESQLAKG